MKNLKKVFLLLPILLAFAQGLSAANEIEFERGSWKEILAKASKENKLIFFDAYTTWCGPCKWMAANSFTNPEVAEFYNSKFINASFDMERGEGEGLAKQYGVRAYPTLFFIDGKGNVVHTAIGALDAAKLLDLGRQVLDPSFVSITGLQERFDKGERSLGFLKDFLLRIDQGHPYLVPALDAIKPSMVGEGLLNADCWPVFQKYFWKPNSEYVAYFLENRSKFEAKFGKEEVQEKATGLYNNMAATAVREEDDQAYREALAKVRASGLPYAEEAALNAELFYYQYKQDWSSYATKAEQLVPVMRTPKAMACNSLAWTIYENSEDKKVLKKALKIAEASVAEDAQYENTDTKAMVLLKLGKTKKGIAAGEEAIRLAKAAGHPEDYWMPTQKALDAASGK